MSSLINRDELLRLQREHERYKKNQVGYSTALESYGEYYKSDPNKPFQASVYDQCFGQLGFTTREKEMVGMAVEEAKKQNKNTPTFTILDDGGGNGRTVPIMEEHLKEATQRGKKASLIIYDLAEAGLEEFIKKQDKPHDTYGQTYDVLEFQNKIGIQGGQKALLRKGDQTIRLLCGRPSDTYQQTAQMIGSVDVVAAMYGVLNCVGKSEAIANNLKMLKQICEGAGVFTVGTYNAFPQQSAAFGELRRQSQQKGESLPSPFDEEGMIYYERVKKTGEAKQAKILEFPYHLFSASSFEDLLQAGGFNLAKPLQVASIGHTYTITSAEQFDQRDAFYSRLLTSAHNVQRCLFEDREKADQCFNH